MKFFETMRASFGRISRHPGVYGMAVLLALVTAVFIQQSWHHAAVEEAPPAQTQASVGLVQKLHELPTRPSQTYEMGALAGRKVCDLYAEYLGLPCVQPSRHHAGVPAIIPARLAINWDKSLVDLWARKVARSPRNMVVLNTSEAFLTEYLNGDRGLTTFDEYKARASYVANETWLALDWQRVGTFYHSKRFGTLTPAKVALLRDIAGQVRGNDLMSYGAAELMPSSDGWLNHNYIDFVLRNAGRDWWERVPAEHDGWTSYGFYQFTSLALYDVRGVRRGASIPNQALPARLRVPGSVTMLRGDAHFRAAYLFAVDNLAEFILRLNPREMKTLTKVWRGGDRNIAEFVALAHHSPGSAYGAGLRWLDHGGRGDFARSTSRIEHIYATKASANYDAFQ